MTDYDKPHAFEAWAYKHDECYQPTCGACGQVFHRPIHYGFVPVVFEIRNGKYQKRDDNDKK